MTYTAVDEVAIDAENVIRLLDGLPGALSRTQLGRRQAESSETISLDDLA